MMQKLAVRLPNCVLYSMNYEKCTDCIYSTICMQINLKSLTLRPDLVFCVEQA